MHSTTTSSLPLALALALATVTLSSCADGGTEDRFPQSEVKFRATNHLFSFRSLRGFGSVPPVDPDRVFTSSDKLEVFDDSRYTIGATSGSYALEETGEFSLFFGGSGPEPSVVFLGGYGLETVSSATLPAKELFFTDRVSTPQSQSIGLYFGTRVVQGPVELAGDWHLVSLHAIFGQIVSTAESVGRAAHGSINITTGSPGTQRTISGSGSQSDATLEPSNITFGGTITNPLNPGDGTCSLTPTYGPDAREMLAVAEGDSTAGRLVLGLDAEESDGEAGLLFMVRKFEPTTPAEANDVPPRFLVGGHTLFVKPPNLGSDTFVGVVTFSQPNSFRLDAVGNQGIDFSYSGTWQLTRTAGPGTEDGGITITINGTGETWFAAIDRTYNTLVFVDDWVETRSNGVSELNIGFGVREN